jgi:hypothetical protein
MTLCRILSFWLLLWYFSWFYFCFLLSQSRDQNIQRRCPRVSVSDGRSKRFPIHINSSMWGGDIYHQYTKLQPDVSQVEVVTTYCDTYNTQSERPPVLVKLPQTSRHLSSKVLFMTTDVFYNFVS